MRKDLLRRLEILERRPPRYRVDGLIWVAHVGNEVRSQLTANQRVVEDWHLDLNFGLSHIGERVAADSSDVGFNYHGDGSLERADDSSLRRETIVVGDSRFFRCSLAADT